MKERRYCVLLCLAAFSWLLSACGVDQPSSGTYRATLESPGGELPLLLTMENTPLSLRLLQSNHWVNASDVSLQQGRLHARLPDQGGELSVILSRTGFKGEVRTTSANGHSLVLPITARLGVSYRFVARPATDNADISGSWLLESSAPIAPSSTPSPLRLVLRQTHSEVDGRLELGADQQISLLGQVSGDAIYLSGLGFGHVLLFKGQVDAHGNLSGQLWDANNAGTWNAHLLADSTPGSDVDPARTTLLPWGLGR